MKNSIDIGLAVLCSDYFRREHGPVMRYDIMAEACDTSPENMRQLCERTIAKVGRKLMVRGVGRHEALIALEMMARQGCYSSPHEEICPSECPLANA